MATKTDKKALKIWSLLICAARERRNYTYGGVSKIVKHPAVGMGQILDPIRLLCLRNGFPPLTTLVVNKQAGKPGVGLPSDNYLTDFEDVCSFDWFSVDMPETRDFMEAREWGKAYNR